MNFERNISTTQITWVVGLLVGLGVAFILGSAIGSQDFQKVLLILGAGIGTAVFLALGKHYWLLIPFSLGAKFPALPLGGRNLEFPELAIAGCSLFFILRVATRREKLHLFRAVNAPFLLFMAWVGMVFVLNPIGLAMMGSSVGGGRFYLKLGLAFAAFVILSSRTYTEKDMRWVLGFLVFGAFFSAIYGIAEYALIGPQIDPTSGMVVESFYSWHQVLSVPATTIAFLIFARWSPKEVFGIQRLGIFVTYLLCIGFILLSGKRMALASMILAPVVSAIVFRQPKYILVAGVLVFGGLMTIVAGQGQWLNLPLVAQRTLSWLPGDWDPELETMRGGTDEWRAELRRVALENISRDPIVGRGFAIDLQETVTAIGMQARGGEMEIQAAAYALGRSWHNTWLGYAADFGIPFALLQAIIVGSVLILSFKTFRYYGNSSPFGVFALYVFIFTCRDVMASWTSGHSALDAYDRWWMYGIVVALYLQSTLTKARSDRPMDRQRLQSEQMPATPAEAVAN